MLAMVTDYDAWRDEEAGVEAHEVFATMKANAALARAAVRELVRLCPKSARPARLTALDGAFATAPAQRDPACWRGWMRWRAGCCDKGKTPAFAGRGFKP
jgi:5'-methylthioadenosine phosphorylase